MQESAQMSSFRCQICAMPTSTFTTDFRHIICSNACYNKLGTPLPMNESVKEEPRILSASGRGEVKVMPDRVRVTVVVIRKAATVSEVNQLLVSNANKLIELLKKNQHAEKIETADLRIQPLYAVESAEQEQARHRRNEAREIVEYEGRFPISFESLIALSGSLINLVLKDDYADSVEGLRYIVSDAVSKPAYTEALRLAALDAEAQANVVLETLRLRKTAIVRVSVRETTYGAQYSQESASSFMAKRELDSTELMAPEDNIVASVSIDVSYE